MRNFLRLVVFLILIISIVTLGKDVYTQIKKFEEIRQVELESKKLAEENKALKEKQKNEYSQFSLEKQARDKLNYKKEGEVLYVVPLQSRDEQPIGEPENWMKWYELFFR